MLDCAEVPLFEQVWFDNQAMANVIAWTEMRDHHNCQPTGNHQEDRVKVTHTSTGEVMHFFKIMGIAHVHQKHMKKNKKWI